MAEETHRWLNLMEKELTIGSDLMGNIKRFIQENELELKEHKICVDVVGYEGAINAYHVKDDADLAVCCTCSRYFDTEYYGCCDDCGKPRCYDCALGGESHECNNLQA